MEDLSGKHWFASEDPAWGAGLILLLSRYGAFLNHGVRENDGELRRDDFARGVSLGPKALRDISIFAQGIVQCDDCYAWFRNVDGMPVCPVCGKVC